MNFFTDIYNNYFSVNLKDFDKIGIDLEINKILFFVFIGLCIATIVISVTQMNISLLLKKLLRLEIFSEDKAKTLSELKLDKNLVIKHLLSKTSGRLLSVITFVGYKKPTYEEYVSYEKAIKAVRFKPEKAKNTLNKASVPTLTPNLEVCAIYIEHEKVGAAEELFKSNSTTVLKTVISCAVILIFYVAIMLLMPGILSLINGILA